ncbi:MAG TPA: XdhC family protein [Thermoanaerobaculia bacterium]|jgi:xanthine dehydrogenase accessory factor|nr:XdhC family protein [Thermoanaerobaculia bacterium]
MSHETFELIDRLRRTGRRAAMATLVRAHGTTPRKEGTKMFVGDDGGIFGSVTIGGCVDARVIERTAEVLGSAKPQLLQMQLGDDEAWEIGLTCGGSVEVFIEPLNDATLAMYETAHREWEAGRSTAIATVVAGDAIGSRSLVDPEERSTADVYVEVLRPPARLCVFGAGAVAIPLTTFARALGFQTIVIDGRARFASRERFPDANELRVGIASEIAGQLDLGANTPVVLVAHDYKIDVPVLKKALDSTTPYIGLLGSRKRGAAILQLLREDGVVEEELSRIRVPVGLDIGGETSAEIALSIVAEVVAVMRGRSGGAMMRRS